MMFSFQSICSGAKIGMCKLKRDLSEGGSSNNFPDFALASVIDTSKGLEKSVLNMSNCGRSIHEGRTS